MKELSFSDVVRASLPGIWFRDLSSSSLLRLLVIQFFALMLFLLRAFSTWTVTTTLLGCCVETFDGADMGSFVIASFDLRRVVSEQITAPQDLDLLNGGVFARFEAARHLPMPQNSDVAYFDIQWELLDGLSQVFYTLTSQCQLSLIACFCKITAVDWRESLTELLAVCFPISDHLMILLGNLVKFSNSHMSMSEQFLN